MRKQFHDLAEKCRIKIGFMESRHGDLFGAFKLKSPFSPSEYLQAIASNGSDWGLCRLPLPAWEHVSVSLPNRCPTWAEMCWVKDLFWLPDECVVQFHPPKSQNRSFHDYCLHMWRVIGVDFPMPPAITVAPG